MHSENLEQWQHSHDFSTHNQEAETNTKRVVWLTVIMMVIEIAAGWAFGSMALLADGWHMGTHAAALGLALFAYQYARRHASNAEFSFGTGKVSVLGGYTSAIILGVVALLMVLESGQRLFAPEVIQFDQAIAVAVLGLVVNLVSAYMLKGHDHGHHHGHDHSHDHEHADSDSRHDHKPGHHQDHNLRAAYMHVIADALTSVLAIIALLAGRSYGLVWMDPLMGIVGAVIISRWAFALAKDTANILLDRETDQKLRTAIATAIEADADNRIVDLHVWRVNADQLSAVVSIVTHEPRAPDHYKSLVGDLTELVHLTIEVQHCQHPTLS